MFGSIISENLGAVVSLVIFIIVQAACVARSVWLASLTARKVDHLEQMFHSHMQSNTLHRTPDFEARIAQFAQLLEEIRADVKQLLLKEN